MIERWGGVVLAGGQARRLGGIDKAALRLKGTSFLDIAVARLEREVEHLAISLHSPDQTTSSAGYEVVYDHLINGKAIGPAGAIYAALDWAKAMRLKGVVTLPVDTPYLPNCLITDLLRRATAVGACYAQSHRGPEWAHGVWMCEDAASIKNAVETSNARSLRKLHEICNSKAVEFSRERDFDFLNVNSAVDLEMLGAIILK